MTDKFVPQRVYKRTRIDVMGPDGWIFHHESPSIAEAKKEAKQRGLKLSQLTFKECEVWGKPKARGAVR